MTDDDYDENTPSVVPPDDAARRGRRPDPTVTLDFPSPFAGSALPATRPPPARVGLPAARLVVLHGKSVGRRYALDESNTIGRDPQCGVALADSMASRKHATLKRRPDGEWELSDLGSRNGTDINGRRATREPIRFGDRIQIGETVLLFAHVDPLEERILQRQKLEGIGRLGAGIAHDINNILGGIVMNVHFLAQLDPARTLHDPDVRESLEDLGAAAQLGADLTRRILALTGRRPTEHQQVDLSTLVHEATELARRTLPRTIQIRAEIVPNIHVRGEHGPLQQVLLNLFLNARDAMPRGGELRVSLGHSTPSDVDAERVAVAGHHATITVADDGIGMDEATRARIFEPFFTTKGPEAGSGLGLANVHDIVTAHGGTVECRSAKGKGATFRLVLPALLATARAESRTPIGLVRRDSTSPRTILVVEDEPISRRGLCRLLEREGHRALAAGDGRAAIEALKRDPQGVDLVLMDLDMPVLDGEAAYRAMVATDPSPPPVFIMTGFVDDQRRAALLQAGVRAVLTKPLALEALRAAIAHAPPRPAGTRP